jgi:hypothetical protein
MRRRHQLLNDARIFSCGKARIIFALRPSTHHLLPPCHSQRLVLRPRFSQPLIAQLNSDQTSSGILLLKLAPHSYVVSQNDNFCYLAGAKD